MKVLVIGNGNLGIDLAITASKYGHIVKLNGRYPCPNMEILNFKPDIIFNCTGAGSVGGDFIKQLDTFVTFTDKIASIMPDNCTLINFSSDYAVDPKTKYGLSKKSMEELSRILNRNGKNVKVIRVMNLYGTHRPKNTILFKLKKLGEEGRPVMVSNNIICPTPTDWLAEKILSHLNDVNNWPIISEMCPTCYLRVEQLFRILNPNIEVEVGIPNPNHPVTKNIRAIFNESCISLLNNRIDFWLDSSNFT